MPAGKTASNSGRQRGLTLFEAVSNCRPFRADAGTSGMVTSQTVQACSASAEARNVALIRAANALQQAKYNIIQNRGSIDGLTRMHRSRLTPPANQSNPASKNFVNPQPLTRLANRMQDRITQYQNRADRGHPDLRRRQTHCTGAIRDRVQPAGTRAVKSE